MANFDDDDQADLMRRLADEQAQADLMRRLLGATLGVVEAQDAPQAPVPPRVSPPIATPFGALGYQFEAEMDTQYSTAGIGNEEAINDAIKKLERGGSTSEVPERVTAWLETDGTLDADGREAVSRIGPQQLGRFMGCARYSQDQVAIAGLLAKRVRRCSVKHVVAALDVIGATQYEPAVVAAMVPHVPDDELGGTGRETILARLSSAFNRRQVEKAIAERMGEVDHTDVLADLLR